MKAQFLLRFVHTALFLAGISPLCSAAPSITSQPQPRIAFTGEPVIFSVKATGTGALSCQWLKDGLAIPEQTGTTLRIDHAQYPDAADYSVRLTDSTGSVDSASARLTMMVGDTAAMGTGLNSNGQIGDGSTIDRLNLTPATVVSKIAGRPVTAIAVGQNHSLALTADGKVYAWGDNTNGQLGDGTTTQRSLPVAVNTSGVLAGKTVVAIAAGQYHSLALTSDGKVYCWGYNYYGQLGEGTTTTSTTPKAVSTWGVLAGRTVIAIAAGQSHSLALTSDGKVFSWGYNTYGQLGDGTSTNNSLPTTADVSGTAGKPVTAIAAGQYHSLALTSDGRVFAWGYNGYNQLGDGTSSQRYTPVAVSTADALYGKTVTAIAAGQYHSLALTSEGRVYAWGNNSNGQLGDGTTTQRSVPVAVATTGALAGKTIQAISSHPYGSHCLALSTDGVVYGWGNDGSGQLGDGGTASRPLPVPLTADGALGGRFVNRIAAGVTHSLILASDNKVYACGDNTYGQLGDGSSTQRLTVVMSGDSPLSTKAIQAIAANSSHTLALTADGLVYSCGYNTYGQLGDGTSTQRTIPVAVNTSGVLAGKTVSGIACGNYHSICLTSDGKVFGWGYNSYGQLGDGSTSSSTLPKAVDMTGALAGKAVTAVAAGQSHTLALTSDGKVYAWGYNSYGQLGDGTTTDHYIPVPVDVSGVLNGKTVVAIAAGRYHSLALTSDGRVYGWGYNSYGQLGDGSTTQRTTPVAVSTNGVLSGKVITAISAGGDYSGFSLALAWDGTVYSWGYNSYGQLGDGTNTQRSTPVAVITNGVLSGKTVTKIAAGMYHSVVLCSDGKTYAWGNNGNGELADGTTTPRYTPVAMDFTPFAPLRTAAGIAAGAYHSMVLVASNGPRAIAQAARTAEETPVSLTLTGTDTQGDPLTCSIVAQPGKGTLSGTIPHLVYTPNLNATGTDSFSFKVNDGMTDSTPAQVTISISPVQDPPIASSQSVVTDEDNAKAIVLFGTDPDGDALTYTVISNPSNGVLSGTAPNLTYTPNANFNGPDSFTFKVTDGQADSNTATVSMTVNPVNDIPVASAQTVSTDEDTPVSILLTGSDQEGASLTYSLLTSPGKGVLSGSGANLVYTPNLNVNGTDSFTFRVNDGLANSATATVTITIAPVADVPVAVNDSATLNEDTSVTLNVLFNDTDGDKDPLTIAYFTQGEHGDVVAIGNSLKYIPASNFNGTDSFEYVVTDGVFYSNTAKVTVTVKPVNDAPVATPQAVTLAEDTSRAITLTGTDTENDALSYAIVTQPTHGVLSGTAPTLAYTPEANYNGPDSFTFTVNDGQVDSAKAATVSITVTPVNDAPVAVADVATVHGQPVLIPILSNDTDVENDAITLVSVSQGAHGSVSVDNSQAVSYTPDASFGAANGDTFHYTISDGQGGTATGTVTILKGNTAPVAQADALTCSGTSVSFAVTTNDSDADGDTLAVSAVTQPTSGTAAFSGNSVTYTPGKLALADHFTYTVSDGFGGTATAMVTVTATAPVETDEKKAGRDGSGDQVAGEPAGTRLVSVGIPSVRDAGRKAFTAVLSTGSNKLSAVLTGTDASVWLRQGQVAPNEFGNLGIGIFTGFATPLINNSGKAAVLATLTGPGISEANQTGLWTDAFGQLVLVARCGTTAPALPGTALSSIDSVVLGDGQNGAILAFTGHIGTPGSSAAPVSALWATNSTGTTLLLRAGDSLTLDGTPYTVERFDALGVVKGSPGQGRGTVQDSVVVHGYFASGVEAIVVLAPGQPAEAVGVTGSGLRGSALAAVVDSFGCPTLGSNGAVGGRVRFLAGIAGVTLENREALLIGGTAADYADLLARQGSLAFDANGGPLQGAFYKRLSDPAIDSLGRAAFTATLTGRSVRPGNDTGLWWGKPGSIRLVARENNPAPGTPGRFGRILSFALPDTADAQKAIGPVFVATLKLGAGGVTSGNDSGLWAVNSQGQLQLVVREGAKVDVGGTSKKVAKIDTLGAIAGSPAQQRFYNTERTITYRLTFTDGSQSIINSLIP